ncbi:hypothetical protein CCH79_00002410 [Gambusia affinis]|uniref:DUF6729 domain-containing protein n=1 Tax=Gambusia affinis TaxID=33528 RepID=A0A315VH75_GAMAF|nr:hypothetical protein CCH79_00002410 [Gambusia affinis]
MIAPPDPMVYFRQKIFLWAPMRMWGISLKCHQCNTKVHHSGIYQKVREVKDLDSRCYLIGEIICDALHKKKSALARSHDVIHQNPPEFIPLPLAQWFETLNANKILCHLSKMKGVITSNTTEF